MYLFSSCFMSTEGRRERERLIDFIRRSAVMWMRARSLQTRNDWNTNWKDCLKTKRQSQSFSTKRRAANGWDVWEKGGTALILATRTGQEYNSHCWGSWRKKMFHCFVYGYVLTTRNIFNTYFIHSFIHLSMALQPFVGSWPLLLFRNSFT
jgi:hypothetical protein